ncbi:unnamed protein product [Heligmosomoides polygyrus]|uniref:Uncharacterized protein n=1 Tax=Heligmosomoides polygyrus TaxID=6339 RepID=A0A183GCR8_HELPZ|nr:unnamed protein product [Heligmosomoides polygyrus]
MKTKMLRWTAGVARMDRIRNDVIRQKFGSRKMRTRCAKLACDGLGKVASRHQKSGPSYEAGQTLKKVKRKKKKMKKKKKK